MDIKRAKEEIKDSIEAYLLKDAYGLKYSASLCSVISRMVMEFPLLLFFHYTRNHKKNLY